jgi:hypothetical protein
MQQTAEVIKEMTETASRIANLPQAKLALLLEQLRRKTRDGSEIRALPRTGEGDYFPLSYAQQRLWLMSQANPGSPLLNIPAAWRLEGQLDQQALRAAFTEVCRRHESMRTTFAIRDHEPVQTITPPAQVALPVIDLITLPEPEQEIEVKRIGLESLRSPFNLERGPLMRVCLLRLAEDVHELLMTMHHIITDGWSFSILLRELSVLYDAYKRDEASPLPELEVQYADYAVWERERLQGKKFELQLSYWKEQLSSSLAPLNLSGKSARESERSYRGAGRLMILSPELTQKIRAFNKHQGVTLYISMLAVFQALLSRYTGRDSIGVGSPLAGRRCRQTEPLIGFFINTLVLQTDLSGNPTFLELLSRVRDVYLAGHAHQDVPFQNLVAELQPDRSLGQTPFFQVWFAVQNVRHEPLNMDGLTLKRLNVSVRTAQFDLALIVREEGETISVFLIYDTDLFEVGIAALILNDYETLIQAAITLPESKILETRLNHVDERKAAAATLPEDTEETEDQFVF